MKNFKARLTFFKKHAFTLAEVLITLGVIGIVAAMTLPSLIQKRQNKVLETQFKKSYSMISQVFLSVITDEYGGIVNFGDDDLTNLISSISKRYKNADTSWPVLPEYPNNTAQARCNFLQKYYKNYIGNSGSTKFNDGIIQIADGSTIYFDIGQTGEIYGRIFVALDVNGWRNKPNKYGYDFFVFELEKNGKFTPMGGEDSSFPEERYCSTASDTGGANGYGCTINALTEPKYFINLK